MRAASGRAIGARSDAVLRTAIGARSDAVLRTAMAAPGAIARMKRRVDMLKTLVIVRPRVADLGKSPVNPGHADAPYVAEAVGRPQGRRNGFEGHR